MPTPKPWSHSSLNQFETCGRQYEEVKVLHNFQDQKNPASLWGDEFHKAAERWIKYFVAEVNRLGHPNRELALAVAQGGPVPPHVTLPANMQQYEPYLKQFAVRPGRTFAECEYALNKQLQPCAFYADDVWGRSILDVLTINGDVADIDDHKTGKRKKDMQQLIVNALMVFYHHPEVNAARVSFQWLQEGTEDRETFLRSQINELWDTLIPKLDRYKRAFHLGVFHPKRSGLCKRHCVVNTCEHWGT